MRFAILSAGSGRVKGKRRRGDIMGIDAEIKRAERRIEKLRKEKQLKDLKTRERILRIKSTRKYKVGRAIGKGGLKAGKAIGKGLKRYVEWKTGPRVKQKKKKKSKSIFDFEF